MNDRSPEIVRDGKAFMRQLAYVIGLSLVARIVVLIVLPDPNLPDAGGFELAGKHLFEQGTLHTIIHMPLFPIWSFVMGGGLGVKIADCIISSLTIGLIYGLTLEVFKCRLSAFVAAVIAILYPHFLFYAVSRLSETLYIFLLCAAYLTLYRQKFGWGSILLVLSILTRPSIDLLAPLIIFAFAVVVHRKSVGFGGVQVGKYAVIYILLMSPWWLHNYIKYDAFVRLNLGDGIVLYSGNNPANTSGGGVADGKETDDVDLSPFVEKYSNLIDRNDAFKQAAKDFIFENPDRFVELAAIKFVRFWRLWPYAPDYQAPHIIVASLLSYGVVLAFFIVFVVRCSIKYWRPLVPIYLLIGYLTAVHMVTIGSIRYRLPLEPFLIVLAAHMISLFGMRYRFTRVVFERAYTAFGGDWKKDYP